jgi:hypothetical protein
LTQKSFPNSTPSLESKGSLKSNSPSNSKTLDSTAANSHTSPENSSNKAHWDPTDKSKSKSKHSHLSHTTTTSSQHSKPHSNNEFKASSKNRRKIIDEEKMEGKSHDSKKKEKTTTTFPTEQSIPSFLEMEANENNSSPHFFIPEHNPSHFGSGSQNPPQFFHQAHFANHIQKFTKNSVDIANAINASSNSQKPERILISKADTIMKKDLEDKNKNDRNSKLCSQNSGPIKANHSISVNYNRSSSNMNSRPSMYHLKKDKKHAGQGVVGQSMIGLGEASQNSFDKKPNVNMTQSIIHNSGVAMNEECIVHRDYPSKKLVENDRSMLNFTEFKQHISDQSPRLQAENEYPPKFIESEPVMENRVETLPTNSNTAGLFASQDDDDWNMSGMTERTSEANGMHEIKQMQDIHKMQNKNEESMIFYQAKKLNSNKRSSIKRKREISANVSNTKANMTCNNIYSNTHLNSYTPHIQTTNPGIVDEIKLTPQKKDDSHYRSNQGNSNIFGNEGSNYMRSNIETSSDCKNLNLNLNIDANSINCVNSVLADRNYNHPECRRKYGQTHEKSRRTQKHARPCRTSKKLRKYENIEDAENIGSDDSNHSSVEKSMKSINMSFSMKKQNSLSHHNRNFVSNYTLSHRKYHVLPYNPKNWPPNYEKNKGADGFDLKENKQNHFRKPSGNVANKICVDDRKYNTKYNLNKLCSAKKTTVLKKEFNLQESGKKLNNICYNILDSNSPSFVVQEIHNSNQKRDSIIFEGNDEISVIYPRLDDQPSARSQVNVKKKNASIIRNFG